MHNFTKLAVIVPFAASVGISHAISPISSFSKWVFTKTPAPEAPASPHSTGGIVYDEQIPLQMPLVWGMLYEEIQHMTFTKPGDSQPYYDSDDVKPAAQAYVNNHKAELLAHPLTLAEIAEFGNLDQGVIVPIISPCVNPTTQEVK